MCAAKFSAVAFDLDGTLYPSYRLNIKLLPFMVKHWRLVAAFGKARDIIRSEQEQSPLSARSDFYDYQARLTAERLRRPAEQIQEKIDRLIYRGWEPLFSKIKLFPYVREILDELRSARLKLGLLSDFPPAAKLEYMGIADCWDAVLCSEVSGALKPAIRPFEELADTLGCPPEQILYVGNSRPYDVVGAKRAGMKAALLKPILPNCTNRQIKADFTFYDYRKLRDFVLE